MEGLEEEFGDDETDASNLESGLLRRASEGVSALANNGPQNRNINAGDTQNWVFPKEVVNGPPGVVGPGLPHDNGTQLAHTPALSELRRQQKEKTVYVTLNTCLQPSRSTSSGGDEQSIPPQLQMYISQSSSNQEPGASVSDSNQLAVQVNGGYAIATLEADDDVYVGITAPNGSTFSGLWNYEIACSIDAPFHSSNETWPNLFFVDGDNHAALLITNDTTQTEPNSTTYQEWMAMPPPYGMFAHNQNDPSILGVQYSYCGLRSYAQVIANQEGVDNQNVASMTNRGLGGKPKEQFYITSLNASSNYWGFLVTEGNSTASGAGVVGGGGMVWNATTFSTKSGEAPILLRFLRKSVLLTWAYSNHRKQLCPDV